MTPFPAKQNPKNKNTMKTPSQSPLKIVHPERRPQTEPALAVQDFHAWFHKHHVLNDISVDFLQNRINCIIGPSGSGKSTLIRSLNRINDDIDGFRCTGKVVFQGEDILAPGTDVTRLRTRIGMVFQKPCIFPQSISGNVLFGVRHVRRMSGSEQLELVEEKLRAVSLWKEVHHRLDEPAISLSIGQQQRLCLARTLAVEPEVILLDEPTSSLDPVSTRAIEELLLDLKKNYTIIFVTHDILQAKRIADQLIFLCNGQVIEQGEKERLFRAARRPETRSYLNEEYCDC